MGRRWRCKLIVSLKYIQFLDYKYTGFKEGRWRIKLLISLKIYQRPLNLYYKDTGIMYGRWLYTLIRIIVYKVYILQRYKIMDGH